MVAEKTYPSDDPEGVHISYGATVNSDTTQSGEMIGLNGHGEATQRGLKSRHLQLIALGGAIGTGLFVGSGTVLADCGPAPLLMAYICMSALVWVIMLDLGEMTSYMPIRGLSVPYLVNRFVEPSLAFASGWNYWYAYSILIAAEVTAASLVVEYWTASISPAVWITIILLVILILNIVAVAWFGEAEFWFASVKLIAITGLIIVGIVIFFGGAPDHDRLGFRYWKTPGAFNPYMVSGNTGRFLAFWHAMIKAGFAYILSPELVTAAAGECEAPRRNIPKATRRFIYRLVFFYVLGALVIGVIVPYNSDRLLSAINSSASGAAASPFVIGIQNAGIPVLNHIINAVILTSAWSAGNSFLYAGSRVLYGLACTGQAPKIFSKCNRFGVPYLAVLASFAVGCLGYLNVSNTGATVFNWLTNISTVSGFIAWVVVLYTYLRFRKAVQFQGITDRLPFRSRFQPYATYITMFFIILLALTNGFTVFFPGELSASSFFTAYVTIPIFFVFYLGHKLYFRTPWAKPIHDLDVFNGLEEVEEITEKDVAPVPNNLLQKVWFWIA